MLRRVLFLFRSCHGRHGESVRWRIERSRDISDYFCAGGIRSVVSFYPFPVVSELQSNGLSTRMPGLLSTWV